MPEITKATLADVPSLNVLINSAYRGESSKQGWTTEADLLDGLRSDEPLLTEIINAPGTVFLKYVENNEILGCVRLDTHDDKLYLGMLTVSPKLQGKGIGKELLKAAEKEAHQQRCRAIYMTVISVRSELIAWYERHGYRNTGKRKPFITEDERFGVGKVPLEFLILEKSLGQ